MTLLDVSRFLRRVAATGFVAAAALAADVDAPPGQLVDVGGHRLHIHCIGSGAPTVVIDAGLGAFALEWQGVQRSLAGSTRVCLYDRAGYGWSDPGPLPRTSGRLVEELRVLLDAAGEAAPYLLVGHSFGGYDVQLFAKRHPGLTAGLVLVDASHPGQVQRFLDSPLGLNTAPSRRTGQVVYSGFVVPDNVPDEVRALLYRFGFTPKARQAMTEEYLGFRDSAAEVQAAGSLPDVPLVVLSRGELRDAAATAVAGRMEIFERLWLGLQSELAESVPRSAHLIAERSGHHIHLDQPDLVRDAVLMVRDFALADAARTPPDMHAAWLAFRDASWRLDTLHPGLDLDVPHHEPVYMVFEQGIRARHYAGSSRPAAQLVRYFDGPPRWLDGGAAVGPDGP